MLATRWYKSPDFKFQQVARSLDDLRADPSTLLVQRLFNTCGMECQPAAIMEILKTCRNAGVDPNKAVLQTGLDEWWQLLPYVLARATDKSRIAMQTLLKDPLLSIDQQCHFPHRIQRQGVSVTTPLAHLLVRSFDLNADRIDRPQARPQEDFAPYQTMLSTLMERGLDLNQSDSQGDTLLHTVMRHTEAAWVTWWCDRLLDLGADPEQRNLAGQTMLDVGRERLDNREANSQPKTVEHYTRALAHLEKRVLTAFTGRMVDTLPALASHNRRRL